MDEQLTPTTARSTGEKVIIGALVFLGVAVMVGIQSLFLTHVAAALPADSTWRYITILCFMAPPFMVGALMVFKLNYSRSSAQDWILTIGMGIELLFFAINVIVAVNASAIEDTLIGFVGLILGGLAGLVSVGTVAFALAADPVRAVHKQSIVNHLDTISALHTQNRRNLAAAMQSDRVRARTENAAEIFVMNMMGQLLGQQLTGDADRREVKQVASIAPTPQPARVLNSNAPEQPFEMQHTAESTLRDTSMPYGWVSAMRYLGHDDDEIFSMSKQGVLNRLRRYADIENADPEYIKNELRRFGVSDDKLVTMSQSDAFDNLVSMRFGKRYQDQLKAPPTPSAADPLADATPEEIELLAAILAKTRQAPKA